MYAFIDVETGGFSISKNGVCQIALIITDEKFKVIRKYESLIKPYCRPDSVELVSYKDDAMTINGILVQDLHDKGTHIEEVINNVVTMIFAAKTTGGVTIIGHNSDVFDIPRIKHLCERFHINKNFFDDLPTADTMKIAREKYKLDSYNLENCCTAFNIINQKAHSALSDAYATLELFKKIR